MTLLLLLTMYWIFAMMLIYCATWTTLRKQLKFICLIFSKKISWQVYCAVRGRLPNRKSTETRASVAASIQYLGVSTCIICILNHVVCILVLRHSVVVVLKPCLIISEPLKVLQNVSFVGSITISSPIVILRTNDTFWSTFFRNL